MILDTNAISALAARDRKLLELLRPCPQLVLNLISLGEYRFGVDGSSYKTELLNWMTQLMRGARILQPDIQTLPEYSQIRHQLKRDGTPIPANDVWIAALASQHRMPVVSRDTHFDQVDGIQRIAW